MRRLSHAGSWLVAAMLTGCPLDISVDSDESKDDGEMGETDEDAGGGSGGAADGSTSGGDSDDGGWNYDADCVDEVKQWCANEGRDDESCVQIIDEKCSIPHDDGDMDPDGDDDCSGGLEPDDDCDLVMEKCRDLEPEECEELIAEVCGDDGYGEPRPPEMDDCENTVLTVCKERQLSDEDCEALLYAKCAPEPVEADLCVEDALATCEKLEVAPERCKEWVLSVCEPDSSPPADPSLPPAPKG